jgi:hypothetical protein
LSRQLPVLTRPKRRPRLTPNGPWRLTLGIRTVSRMTWNMTDAVLAPHRLEDWLKLGRDLVRRGLQAPWLAATDGAPGLVRTVYEL